MTKNSIIIILGILLGVMALVATKKSEVITNTVTVTETDTLYIELPPDTIVIDKIKYVSNPIHDTVYVTQEGDSVKKFKGEFMVDDEITVLYDMDVVGILKGFNFGVIKNYPPQEVVTKTITNTKTITKPIEYRALWASLGMDILGNPNVGIEYQNYNKVIGINYNPVDKVIGFNYKLRLFKR